MGTPGTKPAFFFIFVLWILAATPSVSARSHKCKYTKLSTSTSTDKCSNFLKRFQDGWDLNRESVDSETVDFATDNCDYIKKTQTDVEDCCNGWTNSPACDKPNCEGCVNGECLEVPGPGVPASTPPFCRCLNNYGGKKCDEDLRAVNTANQYCFKDKSCEGEKTSTEVMPRSGCCNGGTGSWGSSTRGECASCESTTSQVNDTLVGKELDRVTCMTAGEDIFRTFDDARFTFYSTCTIALLKSSSGIELYTQTVCEAKDKCNCKKVVTLKYMKNDEKYTLVVSEDTVTVTGPTGTNSIPITTEKNSYGNNIVFKREDGSVFFSLLIEELSFRRDDSGLFMLTIKKNSPLVGTLSGVCGNLDGRADNDRGNLDALFKDNIDTNAPCGNGFQECPADKVDEASSACDYLRGNLFRACLDKGVDPAPYYSLCMRAYCTASANGNEKADLARCNVLDIFAQACYKEAALSVTWRTQDFCPKTCDNGKVYMPNVHTNCPLTCGKSAMSYFAESCKTDGHAGCECPVGKARQNGTCVDPTECQCIGDDRRFYNKGSNIQSSDKCFECVCGDYGLWDCKQSADECMGTCSIIGNSVDTFDGMSYAFSADSCSLTLLQDRNGDNKIELQTKSCGTEGETCFRGIKVTVDKDTVGSLQVDSSGQGVVTNGFSTLKLYIRKVSSSYYVIDINPGIRIFVSLDGVVQIEAQTAIYQKATYGLCGTLNGNVKDDMQSPSGSDTTDDTFLSVFGDCVSPKKTPLNSVTQDAVCDQLDNAQLPATAQGNVDTVKKLCTYKKNKKDRCQVLRAFALSLKMSMADVFGLDNKCTSCTEVKRNICDTNCIDFSFPYCKEETISDCGCASGDEYFKDNACVNKMECGCYNMNTTRVIQPGQKYVTGCRECACEGYKMECQQACEEVICAAGQTPWKDLQEEGECARRMCPDKYQIEKKCIEDVRPNQQCYCPTGFFQTYNDKCVAKCPCYEGGDWFDDGYSATKQCKTKTCKNGIWEATDSQKCTGSCILSGSNLRIKQFDADAISENSLNGNCEYVFFTAGGYEVKVRALFCGSNSQGCGHKVTIIVPFLTKGPIELYRGTDGLVMYNNQAYSKDLAPQVALFKTGLFTDIIFEGKLTVRWGEGQTTQVIVSKGAFPSISGLCGNFDGITTNDLQGQDNNRVLSLAEAARNWADMNLCADTAAESEDRCAEGTQKKLWAQSSCKVILEGESFGACRTEVTSSVVQTYYENCVAAACTCNSGGDCECLCDTIAAFAAVCSAAGFPGRFRHQRLCPIQCDYGSQYEACGSSCPKTCGTLDKTCGNIPCVEGCFCPNGYVRADPNTMVCIPEPNCPCEVNGRSVPAGEQITIDCQQCRCQNGSFNCEGEKCVRECKDFEFKCTSGHCVRRSERCDSQFDCVDGSDEINCITTNCTGFKCNNGQCKMPEQKCDSVPDCVDGSDEENCGVTCTESEFQCSGGCVPKSWRCDSHKDCANGEDELDCKVCPTNFTHCNQTYCAPKNAFCDGHDDCGDGSDEVGCTTPMTSTTPDMCQKEEVQITGSTRDVSVTATSGSPDTVFESTGWKPTGETQGTVTMTVTSKDGEQPVLMGVTVTVVGATRIEIQLLDGDNNLVLTEVQTNPSGVIDQTFNNEFTKLVLITDGTLSSLVVKACFEPSEEVTTETTPGTVAPTTGPSTPQGLTTPAKECYEVIDNQVSVTPENGNENLQSLYLSTNEETLRLYIDIRDDAKEGFLNEIAFEYSNVKTVAVQKDDGTELGPPSTVENPSGSLTVKTSEKLKLPIRIILTRVSEGTKIRVKVTEVLGCAEEILQTTVAPTAATATNPPPPPTGPLTTPGTPITTGAPTTPGEPITTGAPTTPVETATTPKVCEEAELKSIGEFSSTPQGATKQDNTADNTFRSDFAVKVDFALNGEPGFKPETLVVKLTNAKTFKIKYFIAGTEEAILKTYDAPSDGSPPFEVPLEGEPVSKIQIIATAETGKEVKVEVTKLEGCAHVEETTPGAPSPTPTPTIAVTTTAPTEFTTTPCRFECNGKCFGTWDAFCKSECGTGDCATTPGGPVTGEATTPEECKENIDAFVVGKAENGQSTADGILSSQSAQLRVLIDTRDDNQQAFIKEVRVEFNNAAAFKIEGDDGSTLNARQTLVREQGTLTIRSPSKLRLPIRVILYRKTDNEALTSKVEDPLGCTEEVTVVPTTTGATPTGAPPTGATPTGTPPAGATPTGAPPTGAPTTGATTPGEPETTVSPPKVCEEAELRSVDAFQAAPLPGTQKDAANDQLFTSDDTVKVTYSLEEAFVPETLVVKLNNVQSFRVKYFIVGEDTPIVKTYDAPADGSSFNVPLDGEPVTKIQIIANAKSATTAVVTVEKLEGCAHPLTTVTPTPAVTVTTAEVTEYTTTACPKFECNGKCIQTWEAFCQSLCADDSCVTEKPPSTTSTIGTTTGAPPTTQPVIPTTQPTTETGCPQEMVPEVPGGPGPILGKKPDTYVEVNDFPTGVFVEEVTDDDEDGQPEGEVFSSVQPDPETNQFKPTPNEPILIVVRPGETPAKPTDGSRTPEEAVNEDPDAEVIAELPRPDGQVDKVYKVTPKDDTPIKVTDPRDVLEQNKPNGDDDFPINKYGPITVIVVDDSPEPKKVLFCEKLTTGTTPGATSGAPTTGTPAVATTQPTETGCPQEMSPEVPGGPGPVEGTVPDTFVQDSDFPAGTFVDEVPDEDEDGQVDGEVFSSVQPDPDTKQFKPTANEPLLIVVRAGETPEKPTDGSLTPQDAVDNDPDAKLVAELPRTDGKVDKVYKVTPKDDTPIKVTDPRDVLEQNKPDDDDDLPINKAGPVRLIILANSDEPRKVVFCEKATAATTAPTVPTTPGATPTTPKQCEDENLTDLEEFNSTPGPNAVNPQGSVFTSDGSGKRVRVELEPKAKEPFTPLAIDVKLTNVKKLTVRYVLAGDEPAQEKVFNNPSDAFSVPVGDAPDTVIKVILIATPEEPSKDVQVEVDKLEACVHPTTGTPAGQTTGPVEPTTKPVEQTTGPAELTTTPNEPTTQTTETGCPQEMSPQVPGGPGPITGNNPGTFVEVNDFPTGTFVEDVPDEDENDKPDGEVFSSVEPDPETKQFKPTPNEPLLIIVRPGGENIYSRRKHFVWQFYSSFIYTVQKKKRIVATCQICFIFRKN
ncbi:mucin-2-like isoform X2 [Littorina saxatilis]|uniref:mucin-2-like isoform X2 n=1 Tax=Littorina saxatilis TaxID=31220 RepID=UPI0038B57085